MPHSAQRRCHCTLINQILPIGSVLRQFCTLNCNISTNCARQPWSAKLLLGRSLSVSRGPDRESYPQIRRSAN